MRIKGIYRTALLALAFGGGSEHRKIPEYEVAYL